MRPPVIIGGGPAGATVALALRHAGQPAILIERAGSVPDKPCGDFLGAAAIRMAEGFGLSLSDLGARPVTHLRLIRRNRIVESALPFQAMALSRRTFDTALLRACERAGARVLMGQPIPMPREEQEDFTFDTAALGTITTGTVFLATGRPSGMVQSSLRLGPSAFKMYFRPQPAAVADLAGHVELALIPGGQAAMQLVDGDRLMLCVLTRRHMPDAEWGSILAETMELVPRLARRLEGATPTLAEPIVARHLPLGFMHRPRGTDHDGVYRVGDQAAMLSSLLADGVSVAMRGAVRATRTLLSGAGAADYHRRLRAMLWPRVRMQAEYGPGAEITPQDGDTTPIALHWNRLIA